MTRPRAIGGEPEGGWECWDETYLTQGSSYEVAGPAPAREDEPIGYVWLLVQGTYQEFPIYRPLPPEPPRRRFGFLP